MYVAPNPSTRAMFAHYLCHAITTANTARHASHCTSKVNATMQAHLSHAWYCYVLRCVPFHYWHPLTYSTQLHYCCHACHYKFIAHACHLQVYAMLDATAARQPSFDRQTHRLPRLHVHIPAQVSRTESGAKHAIITVCTTEFTQAHTVFELARQTFVPVPTSIHPRGERLASTWWMQLRNQEVNHAWTVTEMYTRPQARQ